MQFNNSILRVFFRDETRGMACAWLVALSIFGLQIFMLLPISLDVATTPFSITFKGLCLGIAIYLIIVAMPRVSSLSISTGAVFVISLILIYSIRLIYDVSIREVHIESRHYNGSLSATNIYLYAFGAGFIPAIAIILNAKYVKMKYLINVLIGISCVQILCIMLEILIMFEFQLSIEVFADRYRFVEGTYERDKGNPLNPIIVARYCALNIILILGTSLLGLRQETILRKSVLFYILPILAIVVIFLAASKGPLFSLILVLIVICIAHWRYTNFNISYLLKLVPILILLVVLLVNTIISLQDVDLAMVDRALEFAEGRQSGAKEARDYQWESAITQFLSSPIIGDKIFEDYRGYYPHNISLEVFMSTGILGGVFYVLFIGKSFLIAFKAYLYKRKRIFLVFTLFLGIFLFNQFSLNLFENPGFWCITALFVSIQRNKRDYI